MMRRFRRFGMRPWGMARRPWMWRRPWGMYGGGMGCLPLLLIGLLVVMAFRFIFR